MKIKISFFLGLLVYSVNAQLSNTMNYFIIVPQESQWGFVTPQGIVNNKGIAGNITGSGVGVVCSPSLPYGVKQWTQKTVTTYVCAKKSAQTSAVTAKSCPTNQKAVGKSVQYADYFKNAQKDLLTNVEKIITNLAESFPDFSEGEGYLSNEYLNFSRQLGAQNVSQKNNQLVDVSSQLTQMQSVLPPLNDLADYFANSESVIALDFTTLLGSKVSK